TGARAQGPRARSGVGARRRARHPTRRSAQWRFHRPDGRRLRGHPGAGPVHDRPRGERGSGDGVMADNTEPLSEEEQRAFIEGVLDLAREGRTAPLLEMIDAGVSVDLANARGDTPLILAAYREHPETVDALLRIGASTDLVNG